VQGALRASVGTSRPYRALRALHPTNLEIILPPPHLKKKQLKQKNKTKNLGRRNDRPDSIGNASSLQPLYIVLVSLIVKIFVYLNHIILNDKNIRTSKSYNIE